MKKYKHKEEVENKKREKRKQGKYVPWTGTSGQPEAVLAKYPMQIIIDKMNYEPKKLMREVWDIKGNKKTKEVIDLIDYGRFLLSLIEDEKVSMEDLMKWWEEYDTEILKKNWHDPAWLIKHVDGIKLWDPFRPKSNHIIDGLIEKPFGIIYYLTSDTHRWKLSKDEMEELKNYYYDPVNQENLSKALKGARKKLEALRPTFSSAVEKWMVEIMDNVDVDGDSLKSLLDDEYRDGKRSYYSGNNFRTNKGSAILGIVYSALKDLYGIEFSHSYQKDDPYLSGEIKFKVNKGEEEKLEEFIKDADSMSIDVSDDGDAKTETSGVHNSSFFTDYNHAFTVTITRHGKDDFVKKFPKVCVASSYYSGGWD